MHLTKGEEEIMQYFWGHGALKVSEIVDKMPDPKPAITTVSTLVRILEDKGVLAHKKEGRGYRYYPLLKKSEYSRNFLRRFIGRFYGGDSISLVSHLVEDEEVDVAELYNLISKIQESNGNH